jgi:hypothetical protein
LQFFLLINFGLHGPNVFLKNPHRAHQKAHATSMMVPKDVQHGGWRLARVSRRQFSTTNALPSKTTSLFSGNTMACVRRRDFALHWFGTCGFSRSPLMGRLVWLEVALNGVWTGHGRARANPSFLFRQKQLSNKASPVPKPAHRSSITTLMILKQVSRPHRLKSMRRSLRA